VAAWVQTPTSQRTDSIAAASIAGNRRPSGGFCPNFRTIPRQARKSPNLRLCETAIPETMPHSWVPHIFDSAKPKEKEFSADRITRRLQRAVNTSASAKTRCDLLRLW